MSERPTDALTPQAAAAIADPPMSAADFEAALAAAHARAVTRWPGVVLTAETFGDYVRRRCPEPTASALEALATDDLYLACACAAGDEQALRSLDVANKPSIVTALARAVGGTDPEEQWQSLRAHLFVREQGQPARIEQYSGQGSLRAWLRVTAVRRALNTTRAHHREELVSRPMQIRPADLADPELDFLKLEYREQFRQAFHDTIRGLPLRERGLLRQSIVQRLTARDLAKLHGVHHTTVVRWLGRARQQVIDDTRARLADRLRLTAGELHSLMALIESRVDVSVARVLAEGAEPSEG